MPDSRFFAHSGPVQLAALLRLTPDIEFEPASAELKIETAAPLDLAGERSISFLSARRYVDHLKSTRASAVFVSPDLRHLAPPGVAVLVTRSPQAAWARAAALLHPVRQLDNTQAIHPGALFEEDVYVAPGAVIGDNVRIGRGSRIGPHTTIGPGVTIGRNCLIGSSVYVGFALVGDRVQIASGVVIGEPGFGVAPSPEGAVDVPQLGRVIIQDGVTIGANSCIDRGAFADTVVGENTKIDNLVQIGHSAVLGRSCVMAAQSGLSGSVKVGDGVMFGGQAGIADHITIGSGARIAGSAGLMHNVPPGETWGGLPARPIRQWMRETAWLSKQASERGGKSGN